MNNVKNMLMTFGFLMSGSLLATTDQGFVAQPEVATQSFVDKVKSVDWMTGIDGGKKGLFKGLIFQLIQSFVGGKMGQESESKVANQAIQELVYQIDQATSHQTQGAEYVAENVGRLLSIACTSMMVSNGFKRKNEANIAWLDTFKAGIQRLCDSSMDDFSADKKAIAHVIIKSLLRGLASLPVIDDQTVEDGKWVKNDCGSEKFNGETGYWTTKYATYEPVSPNKQSAALALSNAFFPLLVDGGTKFVNDEFKVVSDKNARRFAGILKAIGRIGVGAALGQKYQS